MVYDDVAGAFDGSLTFIEHECPTASKLLEPVERLEFIARADDVQQIIPAFKLFELIPKR